MAAPAKKTTKTKAKPKPKPLTKDQRADLESKRIADLLVDMNPARLEGVRSLVDNVAFMAVTLEDLRAHINENGVTSEYQNGENQWGTKKSPEFEAFTALMQRYSTAVKQLTDLLPEEVKVDSDPLIDHIKAR